MRFTNILTVAALTGAALAHPGHDVRQEAAERRDFLQNTKRSSLAHCAAKFKARNVQAENVRRRAARVDAARQKRGLKKRDLDTLLATSHNKTCKGYTPQTDPATLFAGYNSCILTPEVTQGPYCMCILFFLDVAPRTALTI